MSTARWEFLRDNLDLPLASGVADARWEPFQIALLNNEATFAVEAKSRQIAWSWTVAAEAVAEALLVGQSSAFVSINLLEATEKIRYARAILDALSVGGLPKLTRDNATGLEFANGARIISLPARPPRGKARLNIYLDEFAHVQADREIYTAALPIISKGGRLRMGSSPLGAGGMFWEIYTEKLRPYPGYGRRATPWWAVFAFCTEVRQAIREAPLLSTAERVARFGNARIQTIYANMLLEDFQQEYEAAFVDESVAWITWEELQAAQDAGLYTVQVTCAGKAIDGALTALGELAEAVRQGKIERVLCGGVDVGRTHDTTELYLVGQTTTGTYPLRGLLTLAGVEYDDQFTVLATALKTLPIAKLLIDQTGLGNNLAENLAKAFPAKAEGVTFTNPSKALWATDAKMLLQQRKTPLPVDRDLVYQIHSIKRTTTGGKNMSFDTAANEKHHCYDDQTEILTSSGWKSIAGVTMADSVATLDGERLVFEHPSAVQAYQYAGPMVRVHNKQVDLLVTPNHRMYVQSYYSKRWRFAEARDLLERPRHKWRFKKNALWEGNERPNVPVGTPEQYAEFLGYYLSEGCKASNKRVILYQNAGPTASAMVAVLRAMGKDKVLVTPTRSGTLRIECYWKALHKSLPDGLASAKRIPREVLGWSPRLLRILLTALMAGDGSIGKQGAGQWTYYSTSHGLAEDVTELLLRIGWCGTVVAHEQSTESWASSPMWRVNINRSRLTPIINKREPNIWAENYDGMIYCVTTRTHLVYVRRNNIATWCGNSDKFWAWALALAGCVSRAPAAHVLEFYQRKLQQSAQEKELIA